MRHIRYALAVLYAVLLGALTGCATVTAAPPGTLLAGSWHIDPVASDDADARVASVMNQAESRMHKALARYGYGPDPGEPHDVDPAPDAPDYSFDTPGDRYGGPGRVGPDFRGLRLRLRQALTPASQLRLSVQGDLVTITSDQLPPRDYRLGERISRFDEYGTSIITATWSKGAFVLKSHYTSHASHSATYSVDPTTGALNLTQELVDPTVGKIILHSVYRRS